MNTKMFTTKCSFLYSQLLKVLISGILTLGESLGKIDANNTNQGLTQLGF